VLVASIHCSTTCHAWLDVDDGHTGSHAAVTVTGSATIGVPRAQLLTGTLRVQLHVDDGPLVAGRSDFPAS
jgi:hypothetical protein